MLNANNISAVIYRGVQGNVERTKQILSIILFGYKQKCFMFEKLDEDKKEKEIEFYVC